MCGHVRPVDAIDTNRAPPPCIAPRRTCTFPPRANHSHHSHQASPNGASAHIAQTYPRGYAGAAQRTKQKQGPTRRAETFLMCASCLGQPPPVPPVPPVPLGSSIPEPRSSRRRSAPRCVSLFCAIPCHVPAMGPSPRSRPGLVSTRLGSMARQNERQMRECRNGMHGCRNTNVCSFWQTTRLLILIMYSMELYLSAKMRGSSMTTCSSRLSTLDHSGYGGYAGCSMDPWLAWLVSSYVNMTQK